MPDKQKLQQEALRFLKDHYIIAISTESNAEPHGAVVYYIVADNSFELYFITDGKSKKARNLRSNSRVAFVVGTGPAVTTIQGVGEIKEITGEDVFIVQKQILSRISREEEENWPISKLKHETLSCFMIKITKLSWLNLDKNNYPEVYLEDYQQVIP